MTLTERISAEALSWIDTPFYPHGTRKLVGVDCVSLALCIYQAAGVIPRTENLPDYKIDTGDHLESSTVLKWLAQSRYFNCAEHPENGCLITMHVGRVVHHVGVMVSDRNFVHCIRRYGTVLADIRDSTWATRVRSVWRPVEPK